MYKFITDIRNWAFDKGFLKQTRTRDKTIALGNLSTGGTGKTPHTLFIGELLSEFATIKVLSRGYGRKTKGFQKVEINRSPLETGDEPLMIKTRHPEWEVAVCESRVEGAQKMSDLKKPEILILDDAYQHRHIARDLNILLTRYDRPFFYDSVLPIGRLRESRSGAARSSVCIVTHCPESLSSDQMTNLRKEIARYTDAEVFFSTMRSNGLKDEKGHKVSTEIKKGVIMAGIAHPKSFSAQVKKVYPVGEFKELFFPDHHNFSGKDIRSIKDRVAQQDGILITTEKDFVRLPDSLKTNLSIQIYCLPIDVEILENQKAKLRQVIMSQLSLSAKE